MLKEELDALLVDMACIEEQPGSVMQSKQGTGKGLLIDRLIGMRIYGTDSY